MKLLQVVCLLLLSSFVVAQQLQCPPGYQLVRKLDLFLQPTPSDIAPVKAPPAADLTTSHGDISAGEKTAAHEAKTIVREASKGTSTTVREESLSPPETGALIEGRLGIKKLIAEKQGNPLNQNPTLQPKVEAITNQEVKGLPADWKVQESQRIWLTTSYNNKDGADDNVTIYTYLKEVERIVNGKRSVENLNYRIYDLGNGKNMREVAGVNITTPTIEDVVKSYGCVKTTDFVNPSLHVEKNVITLSQTEDKPAPNSAAVDVKPLILHIDTTVIEVPAVQKAPQVAAINPEAPKTDVPKVELPKSEAVATPIPAVPKVEIKSDPPKAEAPKADPPKAEVVVTTTQTDVKTEPPKVEPTKTDAPKVDVAPIPKPEELKVDIPKVDMPKVDSPKTEAAKPEAANNEAPKAEVLKPEAPKTESPSLQKPEPNVDTPKSEAPVEVPKAEVHKIDPTAITIHILKADEPKADTPKTEITKVETPKVETIKTDIPKAEAPKTETPKVEAPKVDKIEALKADLPKGQSPKPAQPPKQETKVQAPKTEAPKPADSPATKAAAQPEPQKGHSSKPQPTTVTKVSNKPTSLPVNPYLIDPHYQPPVIARRSPQISTLIEPTYYPTIPSSTYTPSDYIYTPTKYKPRNPIGIQYVTISSYPYNLGRIEYPRSQSVSRTYTQTTASTDSSSSAAKTTDTPAATSTTSAAVASTPAPTAAPASTPAPAK